MSAKKDKQLDQFITDNLLEELGIDEQRVLSRIEFTEKPLYKKPLFYIPTLVCTLLILMTVVSFVSISIYKNTYQPQYGDNDIVYEALSAFEDEVEGYNKLERIKLFQIDQELICGIYYNQINENYYILCYQRSLNYDEYDFVFNLKFFEIKSKINVWSVDILEENTISIYENDVEIFKTNFTK